MVHSYRGEQRFIRLQVARTDTSKTVSFGREEKRTNILTPDITAKAAYTKQQNFTFETTKEGLKQTITTTGHDGLAITRSTLRHVHTGYLLSETDGQGVTTAFTYDKCGRTLTRTQAPDTKFESTTTWEYAIDDKGPVTTETDASGNQLKTYFDGAGRAISVQRLDTDNDHWYDIASQSYNAQGVVDTGTSFDWLVGSSETYSVSSTLSYDGWGGLSKQALSDGTNSINETDQISLTSTVYASADVESTADTDNNTVVSGKLTTTYDEQSLLLLTETNTDTANKTVGVRTYKWDGLGRLWQETDERENTVSRTYDAFGRVLTQTLPDDSVVTRTYAPHLIGDQVASISVKGLNADGKTQTWQLGSQEFDSLGRVKSKVIGGRTTSYTYDGVSQVPSKVTLPSGKSMQYTHIPELGNMVSDMTADGVTQTFSYDKSTADLLVAKEGDIENNNDWDSSGSLVKETFSRNGQSLNAAYTHTLAGEPHTYTDVTGKQTTYERDKHGRVTTITDDALTVTLKYDEFGQLGSQTVVDTATQAKLTTTLTYDDFGRELTRTVEDSKGVTITVSQTWLPNSLLDTRTVKQSGKVVRDESYHYDVRNRLDTYSVKGSELPLDTYGHAMSGQTYQFDALNNLLSVTTTLADGSSNTTAYHYENADDPTQLSSLTHSHHDYPQNIQLKYDDNGRMILDDEGRTLCYDTVGRLVGVSEKGKTTDAATYGYDALSRLVCQNIGDDKDRQLYYRDAELVNELSTKQERKVRLIKAAHTCLGVCDDDNLTLTAGDQNNSLLWSREGSQSNGVSHAWSPYGCGESTSLLPGFNGERVDPVSETYHLGNGYRTYNPRLMRFNCPDSLSPFDAGGINPYAYCSGDPINHVDPSGHMSGQGIAGIVLGALGLGLAIFTGGASIAAAGSVTAALESASATSLAVGALGVVSDATSIASGALEDSNPEASSTLGWVSLGTGVVGFASAVGSARATGKESASGLQRGPSDFYNTPSASGGQITKGSVPVGNATNRSPEWHKVKVGSKRILGADQEIRAHQLDEPLQRLARRKSMWYKPRDVVLLSGTHGTPSGNNYEAGCFNTARRDPKILHKYFYTNEDLVRAQNGPQKSGFRQRVIRAVDMDGMTVDQVKQYYEDPNYHVINAYCFGRNDEALRYFHNVPPVRSYLRPKHIKQGIKGGNITFKNGDMFLT
ncbi:RHS repeat-associated core domain-containing protein [Enterovibrio nigricans]|nr:RHS repeat-associated core domain-containing protein [Enterovibrio nigricans]